MEATRAARSLKAIAGALLAACAIALCAAMPGQAWADTAVAKIGGTGYDTFGEAMEAAEATTGDVTVEIYGEVEFVDGMELRSGSYTSIAFVGKAAGAKITINQSAGGDYLEARGKTVSFTDLTLAKANPKWSGNSGHMGNYFSVQGGTATYTSCVFPNGACTSTGTAAYSNCTFNNASSEYGLWVYDDALVTVSGGTIDSAKGIKVYSEDEASVTSTLTAQGVTFTENVTAKPAVAIGYAAEVKLIGNIYNNPTAEVELDSGADADCEGVVFVAQDGEGNNIAGTFEYVDRGNNGAACGALVTDSNGSTKVYTSVATALADGDTEAGDTVVVIVDPAGNVPSGEYGVVDSGSDAALAVAQVGDVKYASLQDAVEATGGSGTVTLLADVTLTDAITIKEGMDVTVQGGHKITGAEGKDVFVVKGGKLTLAEGLSVHAPTDCCVYITGGDVFTAANLTKGGTKYSVIQGNGNHAGNVTVTGGSVTNQIAEKCAIYWPQEGKLTITGGTITGGTAVRLSSGSLEITGGTLVANGAKHDYVASNGGSVADTGDAVMIENIGGSSGYEAIGSVSITGGSFTSANASAVASYTAGNEGVEALAGFISGGTFSTDPSAYAAEGYEPKMTSEGAFVVQAKDQGNDGGSTVDPGTPVVPDEDGAAGKTDSKADSKSDVLAKTGDAAGMVAAGAGIALAAAGAIALIARRRAA